MRWLLLISLCTLCLSSWAQLSQPSDTRPKKESNFKKTFKGEPGKAALYSLLAPGAGQIYNKRYWKAPLIWGGEGYAIYNLAGRIREYRRLRDEHEMLLMDNPSSPNLTQIFNQKQEARYQREIAWIIVGAAHLLNVVDAFIDRHLILFDTSPDLSAIEHPSWIEPQLSIVTIAIPLSR